MRTCRDRRFRKKQPVTRKLGERSHYQSTAPNQISQARRLYGSDQMKGRVLGIQGVSSPRCSIRVTTRRIV
jgi:hypothetical protein